MYKFAVIEDTKPTNDEFKDYLEKIWPGSSVMQYFTVDAALEAIKSIDFDLVVSDIDMGPGTDKFGGLKIAKAIDATKCPLLIVSGSPQPELSREMFRALDAWDYLQKPVTEADFATQVKRGIAFRAAQQKSNRESEAETEQINTSSSELNIDRRSRTLVTWQGQHVPLTMTQICLLELLVGNTNKTVPYQDLFDELTSGKNKENLRMHISEIKNRFKAVDPNFDRVQTIPMLGYCWRA